MKKKITWAKWNKVESNKEEPINPINSGNPVLITPMGMLSLKVLNNLSDILNLWLGETNFSITGEKANILNNVPGVEILDMFTHYKFRIAIGNNFQEEIVKRDIEQALGVYDKIKLDMDLDKETSEKIKQMIKVKLSQYPQWSIYVLPNKEMDLCIMDDQSNKEKFDSQLLLYEKAKFLVGGKIVKSNSGYLS